MKLFFYLLPKLEER